MKYCIIIKNMLAIDMIHLRNIITWQKQNAQKR